MKIFNNWAAVLNDITQKQIKVDGYENVNKLHIYAQQNNVQPSIRLDSDPGPHNRDKKEGPSRNDHYDAPTRPILGRLNNDQRKAHDIIESSIFGGESFMTLHHKH